MADYRDEGFRARVQIYEVSMLLFGSVRLVFNASSECLLLPPLGSWYTAAKEG